MKFKITAFKPSQGEPDFPDEIKRARDLVIMSVATLMHLHGISRLRVGATRLGPELVKSPTFSPMEDVSALPEPITLLRNTVCRPLVDVLSAYGIHDVELEPEDKEHGKMVSRWTYLTEGDPEEPN